MLHELERIKDGDFTEEFLSETKHLMQVNRNEIVDKPKGLIALVYNQYLNDSTEGDWEKSLNEVDHELIVKVANQIHLDTVYTLTGK